MTRGSHELRHSGAGQRALCVGLAARGANRAADDSRGFDVLPTASALVPGGPCQQRPEPSPSGETSRVRARAGLRLSGACPLRPSCGRGRDVLPRWRVGSCRRRGVRIAARPHPHVAAAGQLRQPIMVASRWTSEQLASELDRRVCDGSCADLAPRLNADAWLGRTVLAGVEVPDGRRVAGNLEARMRKCP
jgi:hypothetical protein